MELTNRHFAIQYRDSEQRVKLLSHLNGRKYNSVRLINNLTPVHQIDVPLIKFETYFNYDGIITDTILNELSINRNYDSVRVSEIKNSQLPPIQDKIVENVVRKYIARSTVGIEKYGTTLEGSKEDRIAFLKHTQEELFDASLYIEKLIQILENENN